MRKDLGAKNYIYPLPAFIVGTYDKNGKANVMQVAWAGMCKSDPPCIAINIDKGHLTSENIRARRAFTLSPATLETLRESDYFGLVSGRNEDKITKTGFHAEKSRKVDAPLFAEYPMTLECKVRSIEEDGQDLRVVGEIINVSVEETCLDEEGRIDPLQIRPLIYDESDFSYHVLGEKVGKAFEDGKKFRASGR